MFFEEYEIIKPDNYKVDNDIGDVYLDCQNDYLHMFNCDYVCDIEFVNIENEKIVNKNIRGDYYYEIISKHFEKTVYVR